MKKIRLNTTIDKSLLDEMKIFAKKKRISLSQLIELHFKAMLRKKRTQKKTIIDLIKSLPQPDKAIVKQSKDKRLFYQGQHK